MLGTVYKSTGSWYSVKLEDGSFLECRIRGKLRLDGIRTTNPVTAGDKVEIESEGENGLITKIFPRDNYIIRKSVNLSKHSHIIAANVDRAYLLVTLVAPQTMLSFVDRFLVSAEAYHIPVTILFNKIDVYDDFGLSVVKEWRDIYEPLGYSCQEISALNPDTITELREEIKGKQVVFSGHSGVGKSTLLNALDEEIGQKVSNISSSHLQGVHTTTFAEMFDIKTGGHVIDTPGIRAFGLIDIEKEELSHLFPEMQSRLNDCKFNNCVHINEPGCAIKSAVEQGDIYIERYHNYVQMFEADDDEIYRKNIYK